MNKVFFLNLLLMYMNIIIMFVALYFSILITINPKNPNLYFERGNLYGQLGKYDLAIQDFIMAIKLNPQNSLYYYYLHRAYICFGALEKALESIKQAVKLDRDNNRYHTDLITVCEKIEQVDNNQITLKQVFETYPEKVDLYKNHLKFFRNIIWIEKQLKDSSAITFKLDFEREKVYDLLKRNDIVAQDFIAAINIDSEKSYFYYFLQHYHYLFLDDLEKALESVKEAIKLAPDENMYYKNLSYVYEKLEQNDNAILTLKQGFEKHLKIDDVECIEEALKDFFMALNLKPEWLISYELLYCERGKLYAEFKKHDLAIQDFTRAINLNSEKVDFYYNLRHREYLALGDLEKALEDIKQGVKLSGYCHELLASVYEKLGQRDNAIIALTQGTEICSNKAQAYAYRAKFYEEIGNLEEAIKDYSTAINYRPDWTTYLYYRAKIYLKLELLNEALKDCNECIEKRPKDYFYFKLRSEVYEAMGEHDLAKADYKTSEQLHPLNR